MQYHNQDKRQKLQNRCSYSHRDCYTSVCSSVFVVTHQSVLYHNKKKRWKWCKTLWLSIHFGSMHMINSRVTSIRWTLTSHRVSILNQWSKFYSQNQMWYTIKTIQCLILIPSQYEYKLILNSLHRLRQYHLYNNLYVYHKARK